MESRRARASGLLALGWALALEGPLAKISVGIAGLIVLGSVVTALVVSRGEHPENVATIPLVASSALAWGAGTLLAFASSTHAFRRDHDAGVRTLMFARARSDSEYLWARAIGLTRVLAALTAGGTVAVGLIAALASRGGGVSTRAFEATGASVAFALAFASTMGPVALATLAARTRVGGYLSLLLVLVLPEILQDWMIQALPEGWGELMSIPGALAVLRRSLLPEAFDPLAFARAFATLALVVVVALLTLRAQLSDFDRERAPS